MVATSKDVPSFSGINTKWPDEKSDFLAYISAQGLFKIFDGTFVAFAIPNNYAAMNASAQEKVDKKVEESDFKFFRAWNFIHTAAKSNMRGLIRTHETQHLYVRSRNLWLAVIDRMERVHERAQAADVVTDEFLSLKMKSTGLGKAGQDFQDFCDEIARVRTRAADLGVVIAPQIVESVLKKGIPPKFNQAQVIATVAGNRNYESYIATVKTAIVAKDLQDTSQRSADDNKKEQSKNEKDSVASLATIIEQIKDKSPEEQAALIAGRFSQGFKQGKGKATNDKATSSKKDSKGKEGNTRYDRGRDGKGRDNDRRGGDRSSGGGGGGSKSSGGGGGRGPDCWDCGKRGHKRGDKECKSPQKRDDYPHKRRTRSRSRSPYRRRDDDRDHRRGDDRDRRDRDERFADRRGRGRAMFSDRDDRYDPDEDRRYRAWEHKSFMMRVQIAPLRAASLITSATSLAYMFVCDTGASVTMTKIKKMFKNLRPDRTPIVQANGARIYSQGIGDVDLHLDDVLPGGVLRDCLYVPDLEYELLSIPQLIENDCKVTFDGDECVVTGPSGADMTLGYLREGLYVRPLDPDDPHTGHSAVAADRDSSQLCAPAIQLPPGQLIHQRCGHVSDTYLYEAERRGLAVGLNLPPRPSQYRYPFCDACARAKSKATASTKTVGSRHNDPRQPGKPVSTAATDDSIPLLKLVKAPTTWAPLSKLTFDLKGPIRPATPGGALYLLLGTCVVCRWRFVYLLKGKDEAATYILLCKDEISGLGGTMKIMKSDNGGEFTSTEFRREIQKHGIT